MDGKVKKKMKMEEQVQTLVRLFSPNAVARALEVASAYEVAN
jgi:hypothetical protein